MKLLNNPMPFVPKVDGILFYHKESHYTHGQTPLVGWLKVWMFTEILSKSNCISIILFSYDSSFWAI